MNPETPTPVVTEEELLEQYAAIALDKQLDLQEAFGQTPWSLDLANGTISFGPERVLPMQVLGMLDKASGKWAWSWTQDWVPGPQQQQARQLHAYGAAHGVRMFTTPQFNGDESDMQIIGSIASGMFGASAHYIADYGSAIMVLTVESAEIAQVPKTDLARIPQVYSKIIAGSGYDVRHRPTLLHYLAQKGYTATETADTISADVAGGTIVATFGEAGHLTQLFATPAA